MILCMSEDEEVIEPASTPVTVPSTPADPPIQPESETEELPPRHPEIVTHEMPRLEHKTQTLNPSDVQKQEKHKKD